MYNNRGFDMKRNSKKSNLISRLFPVVFAHAEEQEPNAETATQPTINFEQLVSQARKEEKDKLYPRIKKLEEENASYLKSTNESLLKIAALSQELEKANSTTETKFQKQIDDLLAETGTLKVELENAKKAVVDEAVVREKVEKEYKVKLYIRDKVAENSESILSILANEITGETEEEVDTKIQEAKEKTLEVKKSLGLVDEEGNPISSPQKKDSKPNKAPTVNPPMESGNEISLDYIRSLDPRSPEYAEFRKKAGLR